MRGLIFDLFSQEEDKPRLVKRSIREGYDEETKKEDGVDKVAIEDEKEEMEPIIEKDTGEIDTDEVSMVSLIQVNRVIEFPLLVAILSWISHSYEH